MAITKEDIKKILRAVTQQSIKDTDFPGVKSVNKSDIVAMVQDRTKKNVAVSFSDFTDSLAKIIDVSKVPVTIDGNTTTLQKVLNDIASFIGSYEQHDDDEEETLVEIKHQANEIGYANDLGLNISTVSTALTYLFNELGEREKVSGIDIFANGGKLAVKITVVKDAGTSRYMQKEIPLTDITGGVMTYINSFFIKAGNTLRLKYDSSPICELYSIEKMQTHPDGVQNVVWFGTNNKLYYNNGTTDVNLGSPAPILYYCGDKIYRYDPVQTVFVEVFNMDILDSKLANKANINSVTGNLDYSVMPHCVLASMGVALDGNVVDLTSAKNSYYYSPTGGCIYYNDADGTKVSGYSAEPNKGLIYCNAATGLLYTWSGTDWNPVKLESEYDFDKKAGVVNVKSSDDSVEKMLTPTQWPQVIISNISSQDYSNLSARELNLGEIIFDANWDHSRYQHLDYEEGQKGRLLLIKERVGLEDPWDLHHVFDPNGDEEHYYYKCVDLGLPQSGTIYCCNDDFYRWDRTANNNYGGFVKINQNVISGGDTVNIPTKLSDLGDDVSSRHFTDELLGKLNSDYNFLRQYRTNIYKSGNALQPEDVINNLESGRTDAPLSAAMGRTLAQFARSVVNEVSETEIDMLPSGVGSYIYFLDSSVRKGMVYMRVQDGETIKELESTKPCIFYSLRQQSLYLWDGHNLNAVSTGGSGGSADIAVIDSQDQNTDAQGVFYFFLRSLLQGEGLNYNALLQGTAENETYSPNAVYTMMLDGGYSKKDIANNQVDQSSEPVSVKDNVIHYQGLRTTMPHYGGILVSNKIKMADTSDIAYIALQVKGPFFADSTTVNITYDDSKVDVYRIDDSKFIGNSDAEPFANNRPPSYPNNIPSRFNLQKVDSNSEITFTNSDFWKARKFMVVRKDAEPDENGLITTGKAVDIEFSTPVETVTVRVVYNTVQLFFKNGVHYLTTQTTYDTTRKASDKASDNKNFQQYLILPLSDKSIENLTRRPWVCQTVDNYLNMQKTPMADASAAIMRVINNYGVNLNEFNVFYASVLYRYDEDGLFRVQAADPDYTNIKLGSSAYSDYRSSSHEIDSIYSYPNRLIERWGTGVVYTHIKDSNHLRDESTEKIPFGLQLSLNNKQVHINELGVITYNPELMFSNIS